MSMLKVLVPWNLGWCQHGAYMNHVPHWIGGKFWVGANMLRSGATLDWHKKMNPPCGVAYMDEYLLTL
jgi:hypothetical protein